MNNIILKNRCPSGTFQCSYGACVDLEAVCNGEPDCVDYSDELLPQCKDKLNVTSADLICGWVLWQCMPCMPWQPPVFKLANSII